MINTENKNAVFYGVGVGPGDPEDLTLKAVRILRECEVIVLPESPKEDCAAYQIAVQAVPELEDKERIALSIPMTRDQERLNRAYEEGFQRILPKLKEGKKTAFLTIGDPVIYSTYTKLQQLAENENITTQIINGITSFCASAAALNIVLTAGNEQFHIIPGREAETTGALNGTEVYMKSGKAIPKLKQYLKDRIEQGEALTVMSVSNCGLPNQNTAETLDQIPETAGYMTTVIVKK